MAKLFPLIPLAPLAVLVLPLLAQGQAQKRDEKMDPAEKLVKTFGEPVRIGQSKAITVKDAKFAVIAQTNWKPAKPALSMPTVAEVDMQLQITNLAEGDVLFPTSNVLGVRILDELGGEVKQKSTRAGRSSKRPVLLAAGASYSLCPRAVLRWDEKANAGELAFADGSGGESVIGPLAPGRYKLTCRYSNPPGEKGARPRVGGPATWVGEAATEEVLVEIADARVRGRGKLPERALWDFAEPLRVREASPVTKNEVRFVLAAQAEWRAKKSEEPVPIEIQLRVTNLSENARCLSHF